MTACDLCGRPDVSAVILTDAARCPECDNLMTSLQELWDVLPEGEQRVVHFASAVGGSMRRTIEHNTEN